MSQPTTAYRDNTYSGAQVEQIREKRALRRKRLQAVGTKNSRRRLRQLAGKQHRFQKDVNHCISKALVQKAAASRKALALEALEGIRQRATFGREQRQRLGNWGFYQDAAGEPPIGAVVSDFRS